MRQAFTLIELIIVVMLISLVGFLVFSEAVKQNKRPDTITPLNLKSTIKSSFPYNEDMEFFCIQNCRDCYIAKGDEIIPFKGNINLGSNLEVYKIDRNNQLVKIEDFGRVKDNKICLRYSLYKNGSSTQLILSNDSGVYYLPSYFGKPKKLEDLDSAKELWLKEDYNLRDSGNYY